MPRDAADAEGVAPPPELPEPEPEPSEPRGALRVLLNVTGAIEFIGIVVGCIALVVGLISLISGHGSGAATESPPPPPVQPVSVPQAHIAGIDVTPVFTASLVTDAGAELAEGVSGPPVQHGFEILVPVKPVSLLGGEIPSFCIAVTVPQANAEGDAGDTFVEGPVGSVTAHGGTELAYPAVLPGSYVLAPDCKEPADGTAAVTLGTVTTRNLGVLAGEYPPDNAMVVFGVQTSGDTTTVTYGAIGGPQGALVPSLYPPASDSCIDSGYPPRYLQPVRALVSQQAAGGGEWMQTGTLVFDGTTQGEFFYDCAQAPQDEPESYIDVP